jgi:hypothetical protein
MVEAAGKADRAQTEGTRKLVVVWGFAFGVGDLPRVKASLKAAEAKAKAIANRKASESESEWSFCWVKDCELLAAKNGD